MSRERHDRDRDPHVDEVAQLRALLDHAMDKLVVIDEEGTYRYANDASERILGIPPSDLVGQNAFELVHPDDRAALEADFETLIARDDRAVETAEYRHRTAADDWVWLESRLANTAVADLGGYVVSSRDVTDRKRAERRERRMETRLQELAANAADVLWMFSADWSELLFINDAYEEIWGQSVDALRADPSHFIEGIHPDDRDRVLDAMERLSAGEGMDLEYRVNPTLEYRRWVWVKAQPVLEDGEVVRIVGFARDITDRRRRERQLRVMDNLLRHNIRNDMNVVIGHAELARTQDGAALTDSVDTIIETATDLLDTAAKEREIIDVLVGIDDPQRVDVVDVIETVAADTRDRHPTCSIGIEAPDAAPALALPELPCALTELLENAAEHAGDDPRIDIEVTSRTDVVRIRVRDNGPPIPCNEYEPLESHSAPTALNHGTGLGLWLVYWVVDISDGEIRFRRGEHGGNVVTIDLPRAPE